MKVVAINGSHRVNGNTAAAFSVMKSVFDSHGIEIEIINVGSNVIRGCIGCESCVGKGKCVFDNDFNALYFSRCPIPYKRNENQAPYYAHIGIYGYKKESLIKMTQLPQSYLEKQEQFLLQFEFL